MWNLRKVKNKEYMKYFYKDTYKILQNNKYVYNRLNKFETKFLKYLRNYGEKEALDFFLYCKNPNLKISLIPIYN